MSYYTLLGAIIKTGLRRKSQPITSKKYRPTPPVLNPAIEVESSIKWERSLVHRERGKGTIADHRYTACKITASCSKL